MIAHVVCSTGMTWNEVCDQITYPRLAALNRYWEDHPPTHVIQAAKIGLKKGRR